MTNPTSDPAPAVVPSPQIQPQHIHVPIISCRVLVDDNLPSTFSLPDGEKVPGDSGTKGIAKESDYGRYTSETKWSSPFILRGDVEEAHGHPGGSVLSRGRSSKGGTFGYW